MSADVLSVGDEMVLNEGSYPVRRSVVVIARLTPTQVTITHGSNQRRFRRDGFRKEIGGSGYHCPTLDAGTPDLVALVRNENRRIALISKIREHGYAKLTTDQLARIAAILDEEA